MLKVIDQTHTEKFTVYNADTVELLPQLPDESIDLSVYSPPFQSLYTYSPTSRDVGNSKTAEDFQKHYGFVVRELLRLTKPGRVSAVHVQDLRTTLNGDGFIGLKDFSGEVIRLHIENGWIYDGRIPVDKNQQVAAIRSHSKSLTMTQMQKDRVWLNPALPDYILKFRKLGENQIPVCNDFLGDEWILYANPVWPEDDYIAKGRYIKALSNQIINVCHTRDNKGNLILKDKLNYNDIKSLLEINSKVQDNYDISFTADDFYPQNGIDRCSEDGAFETWYDIKETDVIQGAFDGREEKDERHICPLQLETIRRCLELWSNKDEVILDPFVGVGSVVYVAVKNQRKAIGIELKESWYKQAIKNIKRLELPQQMSLF